MGYRHSPRDGRERLRGEKQQQQSLMYLRASARLKQKGQFEHSSITAQVWVLHTSAENGTWAGWRAWGRQRPDRSIACISMLPARLWGLGDKGGSFYCFLTLVSDRPCIRTWLSAFVPLFMFYYYVNDLLPDSFSSRLFSFHGSLCKLGKKLKHLILKLCVHVHTGYY